MNRCFRYAGCLVSFWMATNGLLQGDLLSVVIFNCVLRPLLSRLTTVDDVSIFVFADDLTVVSSWVSLSEVFDRLQLFCATTDLVLNLSKCQLWNKGSPAGDYRFVFDQFTCCFYPFLLGALIDIGEPYGPFLVQHDETILLRARKIAKLPVPCDVAYRLFVSLVSSCYTHYALSCDMRPPQCASLRHAHAVTSILVPQRSKWVCREALYSFVTPGQLLDPHLFFTMDILLGFFFNVPHQHSELPLTDCGMLHFVADGVLCVVYVILLRVLVFSLRIRSFLYSTILHILLMNPSTISNTWSETPTDNTSSRKLLLDVKIVGGKLVVDIRLTRSFYLSQHDPLNKFALRFILASSVDHVVVYFGPIWFLVHNYASLFPIRGEC